MSLEEALKANTAALEANTAALKAGGGKPTAGASSGGATTYKGKHTHEEMKAALKEVKDKVSLEACQAIFRGISGKDATKDIVDPEHIDKCYEAAKAKLAETKEDI